MPFNSRYRYALKHGRRSNPIMPTEPESSPDNNNNPKPSEITTTSSSTPLGPILPKPANFLDLPAELRNEIYPSSLRHPTERRLNLRLKRTPAGTGLHVKEPTPTLCYAVPTLWDEILSIYYAENAFRVRVLTPKQRLVFRTWVRHRADLLQGLKELRLVYKMSEVRVNPRITPEGKQVAETLRLRRGDKSDAGVDDDGAASSVSVWRHSRFGVKRSVCGCLVSKWEVDGWKRLGRIAVKLDGTECVDEGFGEIGGGNDGDDSDEGGVKINPVVDFALKFCRVLDLAASRKVDGDAEHGRLEIFTKDPCVHCGGQVWTAAF